MRCMVILYKILLRNLFVPKGTFFSTERMRLLHEYKLVPRSYEEDQRFTKG